MSGAVSSELRMVAQIARNFAVYGQDRAVAETVEHIRSFWEPRMIARLVKQAPESDSEVIRAVAGHFAG